MNNVRDDKAAPEQKKAAEQKTGYQDKPWIPRFWDGMCVAPWVRLIVRNHFDISAKRIAMAILICGLGAINWLLWLIQIALLGRKIDRTKIQSDPIFVIGHWRSGTTLLHELLVLDPRHTFADTYACFAPNHFLVSGWWMKPCLRFLLPAQRPMDNMAAGWDHPQEDEFALCNMGVPSPYLTAVFPNRPPQCQEYLDFQGVPNAALARWQRAFHWFLRCVSLQNPKRIVLKSPSHTSRLRALLEMFPKAKFVHIVRDPYILFPSTIHLWKRLYCDQGLQKPNFNGLEEHIFNTLTRMYNAFERDRHLIGPGQFCEVRYENLIADPVEQMRLVYEQLELGDFQAVRPGIEAYFASRKDYKTNRYQLAPELRSEISRRWRKYAEQYGYAANQQTLS